MRYPFCILFPLSALCAQAQLQALFDPGIVSTTAAAQWVPTNITGTQAYFSYLDLPQNTKPAGWTDEVHQVVFTQFGATYPTNSSLGVYFNADTTQWFSNSVSGIAWTNLAQTVGGFTSFWITYNITAFGGGGFQCLAGNNAAAGLGFFATTTGVRLDNSADYSVVVATGVTNEFAMAGTNGGTGHNGFAYTNGLLAQEVTASSGNPGTLWGIGRDADGDTQFKGYVKFMLFCTNYTFNTIDISNLHYYATHN